MRKLDDFNIDWVKLSGAFNLSIEDVKSFLDDGRIIGRLGEFLHKSKNDGVRQKENSSFDVTETNNIRTEVRSIRDSVSFASSKEIGYGRKVTEEGFNEKLNSIDRFVLFDGRKLDEGILTSIEVSKEDIFNLKLGKNKSISAKKFFDKYDRIK